MRTMRHYQRYPVSGRGLVHNHPAGKIEFSIYDLSASGMHITADAELMEHEFVTLEIRITDNLIPFFRHIKGRVIRKQSVGSGYRYGIRFVEFPHKDMVEADEYLRLHYSCSSLQDASCEAEQGGYSQRQVMNPAADK